MYNINEPSLEWALKHLLHYYDSDFFPKTFEINAIAQNWSNVKDYILSLDLEKNSKNQYMPKSPLLHIAPKTNGQFRIVHQLDPIDTLIYTGLVYNLHEIIEDYRIPSSKKIACSYRIKPDINGSFFDKDDSGWKNYTERTEELIEKFENGFVLICDISDFYNQIYTHRINNIISEAGKGGADLEAEVIEEFLLNLNKKNSRGIPVGPAASIVLAELIMADIDKKILSYTSDFTRWVDDIRIFFSTKEEAIYVLHELTKYLYTSHRLVFNGNKTNVFSIDEFYDLYFINEEKEEQLAILRKTEEITKETIDELFSDVSLIDYELDDEEYERIYNDVSHEKEFQILSTAYCELLKNIINSGNIDIPTIRHIFRKSSKYRIRSLVPIVLENFEILIPLIREMIIYLIKVLNQRSISNYKSEFVKIIESHYFKWPFINIWVLYLFQNEMFKEADLFPKYKDIFRVRDSALLALIKNDITWIKDYKEGVDILGPWDKRAVIYSSQLFSKDELNPWLNLILANGDIIDKSIALYVKGKK